MEKMQLWNDYQFGGEKGLSGKPIFIPYGEWPWSEYINQEFREAEGKTIAEKLNADVAAGEPGIPVYAGHPDVPALASKYPDKGALGWVRQIEAEPSGLRLFVEWDRYPSKGFAWFSPYWFGSEKPQGKKVLVTIDEIQSIGLVNRPNIKTFRLPNEELVEERKKQMNKEALIQLLGLAAEATEQEIIDAVGQLKTRAEAAEADKAKADAAKLALEDECKTKCANSEKERDEAKAALANEQAEHEKTRTALANEKAEHEKLKSLKTESVTVELANEAAKVDTRMGLVNEIMHKEEVSFEFAWAKAKNQKPELFN